MRGRVRLGDKGGRRHRTAGVTIVELVVAIGVLAVALLALLSVISSAGQLQQTTREKALAYNAARRKIEEMRNRPLDQIYRAFNGTTADDIPGVSCPGSTFAVDGLNADGLGPVGTIVFPENSSGLLDERIADPTLGMPKDLNGDGDAGEVQDAAAAAPHKALTNDNYTILPVKVVIRWRSAGRATSQIEVTTFIIGK